MTASHEVCMISADGQVACTFSQTTLLTLPPMGQEICLSLQNEAKVPMGTVALRVLDIVAKCKPGSKESYFTRSFNMKVESSKQCPRPFIGGPCDAKKCQKLSHNAKIEDLSDTANNSPGYSYCVEVGGDFKFPLTCDWCLVCNIPACLFFRTFAVPTSSKVFEVFKCPTWETEVKVLMSIHIGNKTEEHVTVLHPAQTSSHNHVKLTLNNPFIPPTPLLSSYFITDGTRASLLYGASPRGQPTVGQVGALQCQSLEKAKAFDCYFPAGICSCHPGFSKPHCTCSEMDHETFFSDSQTVLPLNKQGVQIHYEKDELVATFGYNSAVQIQVSIQGLRVITRIDTNTCELSSIDAKGCYNCLKGATLSVMCHTNFGEALATVDCKQHNFLVPCNKTGIRSTATVNFDKANLNEQCTITCPGGSKNFVLTGTLAYVEGPRMGSNYTNPDSQDRSPDGGIWGWITSIDYLAILAFLTSNWTHIILVIITILLVYITIRVLPTILSYLALVIPQLRMIQIARHLHQA